MRSVEALRKLGIPFENYQNHPDFLSLPTVRDEPLWNDLKNPSFDLTWFELVALRMLAVPLSRSLHQQVRMIPHGACQPCTEGNQCDFMLSILLKLFPIIGATAADALYISTGNDLYISYIDCRQIVISIFFISASAFFVAFFYFHL